MCGVRFCRRVALRRRGFGGWTGKPSARRARGGGRRDPAAGGEEPPGSPRGGGGAGGAARSLAGRRAGAAGPRQGGARAGPRRAAAWEPALRTRGRGALALPPNCWARGRRVEPLCDVASPEPHFPRGRMATSLASTGLVACREMGPPGALLCLAERGHPGPHCSRTFDSPHCSLLLTFILWFCLLYSENLY